MKVILDTNCLVYAAKKKVDVVSNIKREYGQSTEIIVPNLVINELEKISEIAKKGSDKKAAKLALQIINFSKLKTARLQGHTDTAILNWAKKNKAIVGTYDIKFKRKLKDAGIAQLDAKCF